MDRLKAWLEATNHGLIIAPSTAHSALLKTMHDMPLKQIQIMDSTQWLNYHADAFKPSATGHVMAHFSLTHAVALELLSALRHINDSTHDPLLERVKHFLTEQSLIDQTPWQMHPISDKICLYHCFETPLMTHRLDTLYERAEITRIAPSKRSESAPYMTFTNAYLEIEALAETLSKALLDHADINTLKVHASSRDYDALFDLIFPRYQLPFVRKEASQLETTALYQTLKAHIDRADSHKNLKGELKRALSTKNHAHLPFIQPVSKALLDVQSLPLKIAKITLIETLKTMRVPRPSYRDVIEIGDFSEYVTDDSTLYIVGAAEGDFPGRVKTASYIDEDVLRAHHLETSKDRVLKARYTGDTLIHSPRLKWVSFASKLLTSEKIPSLTVIEALKAGALKDTAFEPSLNRHSITHDRLTYQKALDEKQRYNQDHALLSHFQATHEIASFTPPPFTRKQAPLDPELNGELLKNRTQISYSRMEDYFKCEFRFLLKNLLGVKEVFTDKLPALIGNLYHETLARIDELSDHLESRYALYHDVLEQVIEAERAPVSMEERFYLYNVLEGLDQFIDHVKAFHAASQFKPFAYEKEIEVDLGGAHLKKMVGIVDKIMHEANRFAIVDYKSSPRDIKLAKYEYALGSQLPFYMSLVKEHVESLDTPVGFFYHPFTLNIEKAENGEPHSAIQEKNWKLDGHITEDAVAQFDPRFEDSPFIKGMGTKKDGDFRKSAHTLTPHELTALTDLIKRRVSEAMAGIEAGKYSVNPKGDEANTPSCKFCEFKDICYKRASDFVPFSTDDDESFLNTLTTGGFA